MLQEGEYPTILGWRYERFPAVDSRTSSPELRLLWTDRLGLSIFQIGRADTKRVRLTFGHDISIDVDTILQSVSDSSRQGLTPANAYHFLADQVYPRILSHKGAFIVHAGGVLVGDRAALFLGPSGYGKSTLAASFDQSGVSLMGDDAICISLGDGFQMARALYPSLRLLPDSLAELFSPSVETAPVATYTIKQRVIRGAQSKDGSREAPIAAIFLINSAPSNEIGIRRLSIARACMACVENSFALNPSDTEHAQRRLTQASALARQVPAFEITYPRDYARLPEVRQAILDQIASLEPA